MTLEYSCAQCTNSLQIQHCHLLYLIIYLLLQKPQTNQTALMLYPDRLSRPKLSWHALEGILTAI